MDDVNLIHQKYDMSLEQFIRFQVILYAFLEDIHLTPHALNALVLLGILGESFQHEFIKHLLHYKVYLSRQSAINAIACLEDTGILMKEHVYRNKKKVKLCDRLFRLNKGNSLLILEAMCK